MPNIKIDSITIENEIHIKARGEMPLSCKEYTVSRNLMSREHYFFKSFKMIWNQWGAQIDGTVGRTVLAKEHTLFYSHDSRPLADIITAMNKWSNNQMARSLIYTLGVSPDGAHATRARGIKVITEELDSYNVPKTALTIINGSGLSRNVRASGNSITQVLRAAWNDKNASEFVSSLSIVGYDGTAAKRSLTDTSQTTMRVKTGSLDDGAAKKQLLTAEHIHTLFSRISDEDCLIMGLNPQWCRPEWLLCSVLPVPPPCVRPSVKQDNSQRMDDDLTHKFSDIIKANNTLKKKIENSSTRKEVIDDWAKVLQYHVATMVDNDISGIIQSSHRSGRALKSIVQRLKGKEGRIRNNLMGKRVDYSARSVITPDPNLELDELGCQDKSNEFETMLAVGDMEIMLALMTSNLQCSYSLLLSPSI
jgi:DNA-directed RNA polymerase beta' subunit